MVGSGQEILFFCSNCQLTSDIAIRHQWHQLSITAQLNGGIFEKFAEKNTVSLKRGIQRVGKIPKLSGPGNGYLIL